MNDVTEKVLMLPSDTIIILVFYCLFMEFLTAFPQGNGGFLHDFVNSKRKKKKTR